MNQPFYGYWTTALNLDLEHALAWLALINYLLSFTTQLITDGHIELNEVTGVWEMNEHWPQVSSLSVSKG